MLENRGGNRLLSGDQTALSNDAIELKDRIQRGGIPAVREHLENVLPFGEKARVGYYSALSQLFCVGIIDESAFADLWNTIDYRKECISSAKPVKKRVARKTPAQLERRAKIAAAIKMPYKMRVKFWRTAHRAVINVIGNVAQQTDGVVELTVKEIADMAHCSQSSVRDAINRLCDNNMIVKIERRIARNRNLPNLLVICCKDWLKFLSIRRRNGGGYKKAKCLKDSIYNKGINRFSALVKTGFETYLLPEWLNLGSKFESPPL